MIATFEQAMSSNQNVTDQPRRSARERHTVNKSRDDVMMTAPATPKKVKPMRLAQTNLDKAAAVSANASSNSSSAQLLFGNRGGTNGGKSSSDRILAMLIELKEKMVEANVNENTKFEEMQSTQTDLLNEVQELKNQNEVLRDEIIELKAAINEQSLVTNPKPSTT